MLSTMRFYLSESLLWVVYQWGPEIEEAEELFRDEMDRWKAKELNVPFVFTEFGTDTMAGLHKLPSIMWSEEYQKEYLEMNFRVFDSYEFVQENWHGILQISRQQKES